VKSLIVGLVIGGAIGAGATYLALRGPGSSAPASVVATDAGTTTDAAARSRRRGVKRRPTARPAAAAQAVDETEESGTAVTDDKPAVPELGAHERQLAWRGAPIATPTRRLDLAGARDGRQLSQDEIDRGIRSNSAAVTACVREARGDAPLAGTVTLEFLVEGNGRATRSRVRAPQYLLDRGLLACSQRAVRGMRFAATGAPTIVTVPFEVR
jgi:hypothetical protein